MNIFENTKFGDKFRTRDGLIGLFIQQNELGDVVYICQPNGYIYCERRVHSNGFCINGCEDLSDIVGKWEEPINEEELDRLAIKAEKVTFLDTELPFQTKWVEGFKAGYRKAKGE